MFNFWEEMYLAIEGGIVNETYLRRSFSTVYLDVFRRFQFWIEKDLQVNQKTHLDQLRSMWS